ETPSAPLAVHTADIEHPGRDGTVCTVLSTAALVLCCAVCAEKPLDDAGLEGEHLAGARGDLAGGLLVHRAGKLDRERIDPPVGRDAPLEEHLRSSVGRGGLLVLFLFEPALLLDGAPLFVLVGILRELTIVLGEHPQDVLAAPGGVAVVVLEVRART